jgi:hypothetical protein
MLVQLPGILGGLLLAAALLAHQVDLPDVWQNKVGRQ